MTDNDSIKTLISIIAQRVTQKGHAYWHSIEWEPTPRVIWYPLPRSTTGQDNRKDMLAIAIDDGKLVPQIVKGGGFKNKIIGYYPPYDLSDPNNEMDIDQWLNMIIGLPTSKYGKSDE